jgi:sugar lactone lactonase YvrE
MEGWLRVFAAEGLVRWDPDGTLLELARTPAPAV